LLKRKRIEREEKLEHMSELSSSSSEGRYKNSRDFHTLAKPEFKIQK